MTDIAVAPTPAQERMAAARAARADKLAAVKAEGAEMLAPELIAQALAQKAEREAAERAEAERQAAATIAQEVGSSPVGPSARARAARAAGEEELARFDRARALAVPTAEEGVKVRVTKFGHNKIHRGIHVPGIGEVYYAWKDEALVPASRAEALQDRGLVEIL